jgi:N-hydroxyarylamine O-acetyltransferase
MERPMKLSRYLHRVGYAASPAPDLETLSAICRRHVATFAFENLDVQLDRALTIDVAGAIEKLVDQRRGGWCYEQNGVLGWALREIGFEVIRACGGVMRETGGDSRLGNHLCLIVRRPGDAQDAWLVDGGFGGSLTAPLPLEETERADAPYRLGLERAGEGYWRFWERVVGEDDRFTFDFRAEAADERLLAAKCHEQQTDPASPFVQNLVVQRREGDAHLSLRGRVLTRTGEAGKRVLASADELVEVLRTQFDLDVPEIARAWPAICARHDAVMAADDGPVSSP